MYLATAAFSFGNMFTLKNKCFTPIDKGWIQYKW